MRFRNCCFTSFQILEFFSQLTEIERHCNYIIFQLELCPQTMQPHIQGYLELKEQMSLTPLKKLLLEQTHIEKRRGTQKQAIEYCLKDETSLGDIYRYQHGEPNNQGKRTDLEDDFRNYLAGNHGEVSSSNLIRYGKAFEQLKKKAIPARTKKPKSYLLVYKKEIDVYKWVYDKFKPETTKFFYKEQTEWNGYEGEDITIIPVQPDWGVLISEYPYTIKQLYMVCQFNSPIVVMTLHFTCADRISKMRNKFYKVYHI